MKNHFNFLLFFTIETKKVDLINLEYENIGKFRLSPNVLF